MNSAPLAVLLTLIPCTTHSNKVSSTGRVLRQGHLAVIMQRKLLWYKMLGSVEAFWGGPTPGSLFQVVRHMWSEVGVRYSLVCSLNFVVVEREAEGPRVASPSDGHLQRRRVAEAPLSILAITPFLLSILLSFNCILVGYTDACVICSCAPISNEYRTCQ